nr:MAG TPA: hypothetical protein [Caudoviricetes sp.]
MYQGFQEIVSLDFLQKIGQLVQNLSKLLGEYRNI